MDLYRCSGCWLTFVEYIWIWINRTVYGVWVMFYCHVRIMHSTRYALFTWAITIRIFNTLVCVLQLNLIRRRCATAWVPYIFLNKSSSYMVLVCLFDSYIIFYWCRSIIKLIRLVGFISMNLSHISEKYDHHGHHWIKQNEHERTRKPRCEEKQYQLLSFVPIFRLLLFFLGNSLVLFCCVSKSYGFNLIDPEEIDFRDVRYNVCRIDYNTYSWVICVHVAMILLILPLILIIRTILSKWHFRGMAGLSFTVMWLLSIMNLRWRTMKKKHKDIQYLLFRILGGARRLIRP